jgi:UDPglucose 6-dehydrogenase
LLKVIAYIGYGFVGHACHKAFEHNCAAIIIDPDKSNSTYEDIWVKQPPLTFVCVPAPTRDDGSVDASRIYAIFDELSGIKYKGIVVVKSTIPPLIAQDLHDKYPKIEYVYSPEFLREAHWEEDALKPKMIILAGKLENYRKVSDFYKKHSGVWDDVEYHYLDYKTAALIKYTLNSYLAMKVIFMNQLRQVYLEQLDDNLADIKWIEFVSVLASDSRFGDSHNQVPGPDGQYGYGGSCFPKDVKAMLGFDKNEHLTVLKEASIINTKLRLAHNETHSNGSP